MKAYNGFDKDLKCRGFQYKLGREYQETEASLCREGVHACENPLDTFRYYPPTDSRYCEVDIDDNGRFRPLAGCKLFHLRPGREPRDRSVTVPLRGVSCFVTTEETFGFVKEFSSPCGV